MRKFLVGLSAAAAITVGLFALAQPSAADAAVRSSSTTEPAGESTEAASTTGGVGPVDVLQVDGLFDEIIVSAIFDAIDGAESSQALILQVNSQGAVVSDERMAALLDKIQDSTVPVAVWVGPAGSRLTGTPAQILAVADVTGMAPGSEVGFVGPPVSPSVELGPALEELQNRSVGLSDARALGVFRQRISDEGIATLPNMVDALDGYESNGVALETTAETVDDAGVVQRETTAVTRLFKLSLIDQLFHTVASPEVAYLLLLTGLSLIIFEFYTAGIGIAAVVGAGCTILAATGLAALPTRPWAVGLILAAMIAFAVDVQVGIPRFWTGVGITLTTIASFSLFEPVGGASLRPSWISLIAGIGGVMLAFIVGMPSMTRTRFSTPTIGREWMVGLTGAAVSEVAPEGVVLVDGAQWRARTNRATPLVVGAEMRVIAIDGVTLEVEPLEGGARDYREMRNRGENAEAETPDPETTSTETTDAETTDAETTDA